MDSQILGSVCRFVPFSIVSLRIRPTDCAEQVVSVVLSLILLSEPVSLLVPQPQLSTVTHQVISVLLNAPMVSTLTIQPDLVLLPALLVLLLIILLTDVFRFVLLNL